MDKLPTEIIASIVSCAPVPDRLVCIRVCKRWYNLITTATLYDKLKFTKAEKFYEALSLFNKKKHIGQHTRHLGISWMDVDIQTLSSLPALFPNVVSLQWMEDHNSTDIINDSTIRSIYQPNLKNWIHLERIVGTFKYLPQYLFESYICDNLKHLEISFADYTLVDNEGTELYGRSMLESLIKNIRSAPQLKHITFSETAIKIIDLENMYDGLPELQEVELKEIFLYNEETANLIVSKPAEHMNSFTLRFFARNGSDVSTIQFERSIANWISYIGQKYPNILQLEILLLWGINHFNYFNYSNILEQAIALALTNMKHITDYAVGVYPITSKILNAMDMCDIQLKKIKVENLLSERMVQERFQLIETSRSTSTLENLEMNCMRYLYNTDLNCSLFGLCDKLANLTHLSLHYGHGISSIIDILQNIPTLETLDCQHWVIIATTANVENDYLDNSIVKRCKLKSLDVRLYSFNAYYNPINMINRTFSIILQSCPFLEKFKLFGYIELCKLPETLSLCFLDNTKLRNIDIDMHDCGYYTFNKEEKRWRSYNDDLVVEDQSNQQEDQSYNIHLDFNGQVTLQLADCVRAYD